MALNAAQKTNLSVTWILGGIATASVVGRMYVRCVQQRNPGWDDLAMMISWCLAATSASLASAGVHYGLGVDLHAIQDPSDRVNALKYLTLAPSPSILSVVFGKISIVLLFHRLLGVSMSRFVSVMLWTLICITVCLSVAAVVAVLAFCMPTASIWDKSIRPSRCMATETQLGIGLAQASFNAFTDFIFGLMPAYSFWNLQMPLRRKIGLIVLFGAGVFGCVITSIKAYQLRNLPGHHNLTKSWSPITIWNTAEMFVLITCANIPIVRSLLRRLVHIRSSPPPSYPLRSTPQKKSLSRRAQGIYLSIDNSSSTRTRVSASRGEARHSVDRMYPLTRRDSGPNAGDETESQEGIVKKAEFTLSYHEAK
ncbi:hypothetical protein BJX61DRAFT_209289 [Aspergillus egyptiacus]|nr:hypothetical protein BJX61DRAFT_209289 [Aspergillus egyptiacus]